MHVCVLAHAHMHAFMSQIIDFVLLQTKIQSLLEYSSILNLGYQFLPLKKKQENKLEEHAIYSQ